MYENFISRAALVAIFFWITAAILLGAVWGLAIFDESSRWSRPLAVTTVIAAGGATLSQIRIHLFRLCAVIRATAGTETAAGPSADVRALR